MVNCFLMALYGVLQRTMAVYGRFMADLLKFMDRK